MVETSIHQKNCTLETNHFLMTRRIGRETIHHKNVFHAHTQQYLQGVIKIHLSSVKLRHLQIHLSVQRTMTILSAFVIRTMYIQKILTLTTIFLNYCDLIYIKFKKKKKKTMKNSKNYLILLLCSIQYKFSENGCLRIVEVNTGAEVFDFSTKSLENEVQIYVFVVQHEPNRSYSRGQNVPLFQDR